jgi:protein-S-isoprenylcysteine O-methyltransferase Ste14
MMRDWKRILYGLHPHLLGWIWGGLLVLQLALVFFVFKSPGIAELWVSGWVIWALGTVFALVPIVTLRVQGGVPKGKSYMATTVLVDRGIYAIVRHPQGATAGILLNLALALIGQHWLIALLSGVGMILIYADALKADQACIEKFGEAYLRYMERVPRANPIVGIIRLLRRRESASTVP